VNPTVTVPHGEEEEGPSTNIFDLMHQTLGQIAIKLLNADPQQTEVLFLEYGLEPILEVMSENALKRNRLIYLLYSFVMPTNNSHLRLL